MVQNNVHSHSTLLRVCLLRSIVRRISFGRRNDGNSGLYSSAIFLQSCHVHLASVCSQSNKLPWRLQWNTKPAGLVVYLVMRPKNQREHEANYPGGKHHVPDRPPALKDPGERGPQQTLALADAGHLAICCLERDTGCSQLEPSPLLLAALAVCLYRLPLIRVLEL